MIVTVTPAPAIDWTVTAIDFVIGEVNRAEFLSREPSGKGVNASWVLHQEGIPTCAVFPSGGLGGDFMTRSLTAAGLAHRAVPVREEVRTNLTLRVKGAPETKINTAANPLSPVEIEALMTAVREVLPGASALLSCGSLPAGAPVRMHRNIVGLGKELGVMTAVDASGEALAEAVLAEPDLIKPNLPELEELTGLRMDSLGDVHAAGAELLRRGVGAVLVSLGPHGALLVDAHGTLYGRASKIVLANAVGAGDALLAGFLAKPESGRVASLTRALVWASSAVQSASTLFVVNSAIEAQVVISDRIDSSLIVRDLTPPSLV